MTYKYNQGTFSCKNPEFFMAVCKYKNHSYTIVGVRDAQTKEQVVLASLGRKGGFVGTFLITEQMPSNDKLIDLQAFTISSEQYRNLIQFVYAMKKDFKSNAGLFAVPSTWLDDADESGNKQDEVHFTWFSPGKKSFNNIRGITDVGDSSFDSKQIRQGLGLDNNCRTAAKYLTQTTIQAESLPNVSSLFFRSLPFKANLSQGIIREQLFIYPPPPHISSKRDVETNKQWDVLGKIYERMDKIAKSATQSGKHLEDSHKKFDSLKELYQTQYNKLTGNKQSIHELMTDINDYINNSSSVIDTKRSKYTFTLFKTATRKMFDSIEKENNIKGPK